MIAFFKKTAILQWFVAESNTSDLLPGDSQWFFQKHDCTLNNL